MYMQHPRQGQEDRVHAHSWAPPGNTNAYTHSMSVALLHTSRLCVSPREWSRWPWLRLVRLGCRSRILCTWLTCRASASEPLRTAVHRQASRVARAGHTLHTATTKKMSHARDCCRGAACAHTHTHTPVGMDMRSESADALVHATRSPTMGCPSTTTLPVGCTSVCTKCAVKVDAAGVWPLG